jgi:hypothetical protein
MDYALALHPQTYVRGLIVVQKKYNTKQFLQLAKKSNVFSKKLLADIREEYDDSSDVQGFCLTTDDQTPWLIVIFKSEPYDIRSVGLHEISHLADALARTTEGRARFIQYAYMAFSDDLDARLAPR